jgi:hypothetical protein
LDAADAAQVAAEREAADAVRRQTADDLRRLVTRKKVA